MMSFEYTAAKLSSSTCLGTLRFAGDFSPWAVFAAAVLVGLSVLVFYVRETRSLSTPLNYLLPSLRAAAVAMVIVILAGPVWHRTVTVGTLGRVIFAVDASESMSVTDSGDTGSSPARLQRAVDRLMGTTDRDAWIDSLAETHQVEVLAFDSGNPAVAYRDSDAEGREGSSGLLTLQADGQRTDLASALESAVATLKPDAAASAELGSEDATPAQQAAVVVFSDGRDNTGASPVDVAQRLRALGAAVHVVGMGSEDEPPSLGVVRVDRPERVAADGTLVGDVVISQSGMGGKPVQVQLESSNGDIIWQQTLNLSDRIQQSVSFDLDVESIIERVIGDAPRGVQRSTVVLDLRAVVSLANAEDAQALSRTSGRSRGTMMPFRVAASTRDRRLLIVDGSSRWEIRYLRNLFQRDPAWSVDTILFGPGTDALTLQRGDRSGQFPSTPKMIAKYDAIILGEVPADQIEQRDAELISGFVTRGGGLILVDGSFDQLRRLSSSQLSDVIPVDYVGQDQVVSDAIKPTRLGLEQPMLNLIGDAQRLSDFWSRLPAPESVALVKPQPGAEVWADAMRPTGQTVAVASDATVWRRASVLFGLW